MTGLLLTLIGCTWNTQERAVFQMKEQTGSDLVILFEDENGPPLQTPFGQISRRAANAICDADHFKVGTVVDVETFYLDWYATDTLVGGKSLFSNILLDEELVLRGAADEQFQILVEGGTDPVSKQQFPVSGYLPQPEIGARYAVSYLVVDNPSHSPLEVPHGSGIASATFTVTPTITLPDQGDVSSDFESFCQEVN